MSSWARQKGQWAVHAQEGKHLPFYPQLPLDQTLVWVRPAQNDWHWEYSAQIGSALWLLILRQKTTQEY